MRKEKLSGSRPRKKASTNAVVPKKLSPKPFPMVGFGASAGGIEAFIKLLRHLDSNLGMAYVLIMHLSPNRKSALAEIIQSKTRMPVHTVTDGMKVRPDNIYVIPPNTYMRLVDGHLKLAPRSLNSLGNFAVDYFLTTLASIYKNNAIGVVLSGTATDGTLGLKAIKAEGGITFAQDESAKFSGMPRNAYDSGYVDFLLPPESIARELARLVNIPYTKLPSDGIESVPKAELDDHKEELKKILTIVKGRTGFDFFANYKHASIYRRIMRRMVLNNFEKLTDYTAMLKSNPKEVDALYNDFLINVTSFFRDPDFYKVLTSNILPSLTRDRAPADPIRIWVAGCSTGEEAYSIAICLIEFLGENNLSFPVQIFASDLDANAIEKARLGSYSMNSVLGVPPYMLKKYFVKIDGYYQINKAVRQLCTFSHQNLLKDPPFSRVDLISCQNVLIYLETNSQAKILQTFHFALKPSGYLVLGKSETIGASMDLFEQLDMKIKIFARKSTKSPQLKFTVHPNENTSAGDQQITGQTFDTDTERDAGKLILSRYVPPCIVVNRNLMIVQFFGVIAPYLEPVTGKASLNVLKIIRGDLVLYLGSLLQKARRTEKVTVKEDIMIKFNKIFRQISIEVAPIKNSSGDVSFLVVFKENPVAQPVANMAKARSPANAKDKAIAKLQEQLAESRDLIRAANEEYQTTHEELQAYNEEILSTNEELQSVNEELETSREELQSAIEELSGTNDELQKRNLELKRSQTYAEAIVETVHNPLVVLKADFRVDMANKAFYQTFKLTKETTQRRPIFELSNNAWEIPALHQHLNELLEEKSNFKEFEIKHSFPGLGELTLNVHAYRLAKSDDATEPLMLLAINNISDLLKTNRELKKVNEQLAEFVFVSSHDLQEPLRKIQIFANFLSRPEANLNDFAKNYSEKINASSSRMSRLIRDLISFSLLGQTERKLLTVDLNETIKNVMSDLQEPIEIKKAVINIAPLPSVCAEPMQMYQLFSNLIDNALKFSRENPVINITSQIVSAENAAKHELPEGKNYVAINVNDNGIGFDQKYASKMFTLFQRLNNTKGVEGSGVGLAICKKIVEDHGGMILANGKENEGATFTVILPV